MARLEAINALAPDEAFRQLLHTCGIESWARGMVKARPFASEAALWKKADELWALMARTEWLEAFSRHPKIGDVDSLRKKFADTAHLAGIEQAGVKGAAEATLKALAAGNVAYERRYGFIFIVCATGKSAAEMLALLEARLGNDPEVELGLAAVEQMKITRLRMEKLGA